MTFFAINSDITSDNHFDSQNKHLKFKGFQSDITCHKFSITFPRETFYFFFSRWDGD